MAIIGSAKLSHMKITIKELNIKHQLNPKNTGVTPIDNVVWYNHANSAIGIGNLLKINKNEQIFTAYKIIAKDMKPFIVAESTVMYTECAMLSIKTGLEPPHKLVIYNETTNELEPHAIIEIQPVDINDDTYIVCSDRRLLIMSNGVMVLSD